MPMNTSRKPNSFSALRQKTLQSAARVIETAGQETPHPLDDEQKLLEILQHLSQQREDLTANKLDQPETPATLPEEKSQGRFQSSAQVDSPPGSVSDLAAIAVDHLTVSEHEMMETFHRLSQQAETLAVTDLESSISTSGTTARSQAEWLGVSGQSAQSSASALSFAEPIVDYWIVSEQDVMGDLHSLSESEEELKVVDLHSSDTSSGNEDSGVHQLYENLDTAVTGETASSSSPYLSDSLLARLGLTSLVVTGGGLGIWLIASVLHPSADHPKSDEWKAGLADRNQQQTVGVTATIAAPTVDSLSPEFNPAAIKPAKHQPPVSSASSLDSTSPSVSSQATTSNPLTSTPEATAPPHSALSSLIQERLLTPEDLKGLSNWDLTLLRNEIYARHGRHFREPELQQYFEAQSWYQSLHAPGKFPISTLSKTEIQNAIFIRDYQSSYEKFYQWK